MKPSIVIQIKILILIKIMQHNIKIERIIKQRAVTLVPIHTKNTDRKYVRVHSQLIL